MKLYNVTYSGNSYKVRLLLAQLGIPCEIIEVDILNGESHTPEFLRINPNGRTPVLDDDGFVLAESNAILAYLARGTKFLTEDRKTWARVFQWMFFEQYSHEPFIATSRFWLQHKPGSPERSTLLAAKRDGGWAALKVMNEHLSKNDFFVGDYSIADIALFAYTHVSHEGGFPLDDSRDQSVDRAGEGTAEFCFDDVASQRVEMVRKGTVRPIMTIILGIVLTVLGIVVLFCIMRELLKPLLRSAKTRREYQHWLEEVEPRLRYSKDYPDDWQMRRREVFKRFGGKCAKCAEWIWRSFVNGFGGHVHHRIPISEGGDHSFDNLELLCEDCHFKKHPGNKTIRFNRNRIVRALALSGAARRARKQWCCVGCDESIFVGDEYYGGAWSKLCLRCRNDVLKERKDGLSMR